MAMDDFTISEMKHVFSKCELARLEQQPEKLCLEQVQDTFSERAFSIFDLNISIPLYFRDKYFTLYSTKLQL